MAQRMRNLPVRLFYFRGPRYASFVRKRWVLFRNPHAHIVFGPNTYLGPGFSIDAPRGGEFLTGAGVAFARRFRAELAGECSTIKIATRSKFTDDVILYCVGSIEIGERCVLARGVTIVDGQHGYHDLQLPVLEQDMDIRPIRIGDDVSIMSNATVLADIGERAFIGANAVVTRPVPARTLAGGIPAKALKDLGESASSPGQPT